MPIRKHGKTWEVRLRNVKPEISRSFARYRDAAEFERRALQRIEDHRVGRTPSYTLEEALDRWLGGEAKDLRSHRNLENKVRAIYPQARGRLLSEVAEVAEEVVKAGRASNLKPATINRRLAILRRIARLAFRRWNWLDRDLSGRISLLPGEEARFVQATPEQAELLIRSAKGMTRAGILWGVMTGLRRSELVRVSEDPEAHFQGNSIVLTRTKTGKARIVPLAPGMRPEDFPRGLRMADLERPFREARSAAGMPWLQFRDLRRTFGSWIVQRTGSLKLAQDLLGHTTPVITSAHYAHMLEGNLRKAVNALPRLSLLKKKRKAA